MKKQNKKKSTTSQVAVVIDANDQKKEMGPALKALKKYGLSHEILTISCHHEPEKLMEFARTAHKAGFKVIIASGRGAAHLPGMIAAHTHLPVIGVPLRSKDFGSEDSVLSMVQMPKGVPVATMGLDQAYNAGIFCAQILGKFKK